MAGKQRSKRRVALHAMRVTLFVTVIVLIHLQHRRATGSGVGVPLNVQHVTELVPDAHTLVPGENDAATVQILDVTGESLGTAIQTSPTADHIVGFSGPTNLLVVFTPEEQPRIAGVRIISSRDTREHVEQVLANETFLESFNGLKWDEAASLTDIDAVSGATLTCMAIHESIVARLGGGETSLRFTDPVKIEQAQEFFETANSVTQDDSAGMLWRVTDLEGKPVGAILRTSPAGDHVNGFQGPTEALIGLDTEDKVVGVIVGATYDNEPYVGWVKEDHYFRSLFNGLLLEELADSEGALAHVEGVSGATMTSQAMANAMLAAAQRHCQPTPGWTMRDIGTSVVVLFGLVLALTRLRGNTTLRYVFQFVLIGYLGLMNGDMVSQALISGWAVNGVAWQTAPGLVCLTVAAFLVPICSKRNVYCSHLCPHGAVQHLVKNRLPWRIHLPRKVMRLLKWVPGLLLLWCALVTVASLPFSLVGIEPFDAWVWAVAGGATVIVAIVGLVASLFIPMAYCRYGCPTGALLNSLRFHGHSDRWSRRDSATIVVTIMAFVFYLNSL